MTRSQGQPVQAFVPAPVATSDPAPRDPSVSQPQSGHGAAPQGLTVSAAAERSDDAETKSPAGAGWSAWGGPFVALLLGLLFLLLLVRRRRREERQEPDLEPALT